MRRHDEVGPSLLLLLLPVKLEQFHLRERAEELLAAPGVLAVEPARVSYRALGALPPLLAYGIARRQAKRMRLPGTPTAIAVFDPHQVPLAVALTERHVGAVLARRPRHRRRSEVALGAEPSRLDAERLDALPEPPQVGRRPHVEHEL